MTTRVRKITDREKWLTKWRPPNINASESGALMGIDKYCSPLKLYHLKLGTIPPDEENAVMRAGRWLEPAVLLATAERRPDLTIVPPVSYIDDPALRIGCTPDAFATDKKGRLGIVQAKTVGENVFKSWKEEGGGIAAPLAYELQTMVEAMQTKRVDFALLSIMVVGYRALDLQILSVPILERTWEVFLKRVKEFWVNVEKRNAPPVTAPIDSDLLKSLYPGEPGSSIDLTGNNRLPELLDKHDAFAAALKAGRAPLKKIEKEYESVRVEIKGIVGDAEIAYLPGNKVTTLKLQTNPGWTTRVLRISDIKPTTPEE